MKISILLPTRENSKNAISTIYSYFNLCSDETDLEVLVWIDEGDIDSINIENEFVLNTNVKIFKFPQIGYFNLDLMYTFLASKSTGSILWSSSCKNLVITKHWDVYLKKYENKFIVASHTTQWIPDRVIEDGKNIAVAWSRPCLLFPIISRQWYNITGNLSKHTHIDTWISDVLQLLAKKNIQYYNDIRIHIPEIEIIHDRNRAPGIKKPGTSTYYSDVAKLERNIDAEKIYDYMEAISNK